jgi:MFS family permease
MAALAGWAADYISGRFSFLLGLGVLFTSMIVICLAHNPWILLLARGSQGLASTLIYTSGLALIAHSVTSDEVGSW